MNHVMLNFSLHEKQRRLLYLNVRYRLDEFLVKYILLDSLTNFKALGEEYPFVDPPSLKPGTKGPNLPEDEVAPHNSGLVVFYEDVIPSELHDHIEIESTNRITKDRLVADKLVDVQFASSFEHPKIYLSHEAFEETLQTLSQTDYGLVIQADPTRPKGQDAYRLSHYRVMIEWSMTAAATSLAKSVGYINRRLSEDGEDKGLALKHKLFEYYGFHYTVGSRRRAAIRASQLLKGTRKLFTVYVGSTQARHLTKITEEGIERFTLLRLPDEHIRQAENIDEQFADRYLLDQNVCVFRVVYRTNEYSQPGKNRKFDPKVQWLRVAHEAIMPLARCPDAPPVPYHVVYGRKDPFSGYPA